MAIMHMEGGTNSIDRYRDDVAEIDRRKKEAEAKAAEKRKQKDIDIAREEEVNKINKNRMKKEAEDRLERAAAEKRYQEDKAHLAELAKSAGRAAKSTAHTTSRTAKTVISRGMNEVYNGSKTLAELDEVHDLVVTPTKNIVMGVGSIALASFISHRGEDISFNEYNRKEDLQKLVRTIGQETQSVQSVLRDQSERASDYLEHERTKFSAERDRVINEVNTKYDSIQRTYESQYSGKELDAHLATLESKRQTELNHAQNKYEQDIAPAVKARDRAVEAETKYTMQTMNDTSYLKDSSETTDSRKGGAEYRFAHALSNEHERLASELVELHGSEHDKTMVRNYEADKLGFAKADKTGIPYTPIQSPEERKEAMAIMEERVGKMNSPKQMIDSSKKLEDAARKIEKGLLAETSLQLNAKMGELENINKKINEIQTAISKESKNGMILGSDGKPALIPTDSPKLKALKAELLKLQGKASDLNVTVGALGRNKEKLMAVAGNCRTSAKATKKYAQLLKRQKRNYKADKKLVRGYQSIGNGILYGAKRWAKLIAKQMPKSAAENDLAWMKGINAKTLKYYQDTRKVIGGAGKLLLKPGKFAKKKIGKSAVGKAIKLKWNNFLTGGKGGKFVGKMIGGGRFLGKGLRVGGSVLLAAPEFILNPGKELEKLAMKGTVKVATGTTKLAGKAVGKTARLAGRGIRFGSKFVGRKIGATRPAIVLKKANRKLKDKAKNALKKVYDKTIGKVVKLVKEKLKKLAEKTAVRVTSKIISVCVKIIVAICHALVAVISAIFSFCGWILILVPIIAVILALFLSVIESVMAWLKSKTTQEQSYVKNDPAVIMKEAVKYRNQELKILELFSDLSYNPEKDPGKDPKERKQINVNSAPIYYAMEDKVFDLGYAWSWFIGRENKKDFVVPENEKERLDNNINPAYVRGLLDAELYDFEFKGKPDDFRYKLDKGYSSCLFRYYPGSVLDEPTGETDDFDMPIYKIKDECKDQIAKYEISNAKDSLGCVDALYTTKKENMQKLEVFTYLGTGDTQVGIKADPNDDSKMSKAENLFWATHKFIYNYGNKPEDVWYHVTRGNGDGKTYTISKDYKYKHNASINAENNVSAYAYTAREEELIEDRYYDTSKECDNQGVVKIKKMGIVYEEKFNKKYVSSADRDDIYGTIILDYQGYDYTSGNNIYHIYSLGGSGQRLSSVSSSLGREYPYHRMVLNYYGDPYEAHYSLDRGTLVYKESPHDSYSFGEYVEKPETYEYPYCKGHINLDVDFVVSAIGRDNVLEEEEAFFKDAQRVQAVDEEHDAGWFGTLNYNSMNDCWGWGPIDIFGFKPEEDWKKGGSLRPLAKVKTVTTADYTINDSESRSVLDILEDSMVIITRSGPAFTIPRTMNGLAYTDRDVLLFGLLFKENELYVRSYISGEQDCLQHHYQLSGLNFNDKVYKYIAIKIQPDAMEGYMDLNVPLKGKIDFDVPKNNHKKPDKK